MVYESPQQHEWNVKHGLGYNEDNLDQKHKGLKQVEDIEWKIFFIIWNMISVFLLLISKIFFEK